MSDPGNEVLGAHYIKAANGGRQHWDECWERYREAWFVCNVTKYVTRYRLKDGLKDLYKCRDYLNELIRREEAEQGDINEQ